MRLSLTPRDPGHQHVVVDPVKEFLQVDIHHPPHRGALAVRLGVPVITASGETPTLQATSRVGLSYRLSAPGYSPGAAPCLAHHVHRRTFHVERGPPCSG